MISASLIGCGILSLVQMSRLKLFGRYYLGTGLLSVVGTSFATLSTAFGVSFLFASFHSLPFSLPRTDPNSNITISD